MITYKITRVKTIACVKQDQWTTHLHIPKKQRGGASKHSVTTLTTVRQTDYLWSILTCGGMSSRSCFLACACQQLTDSVCAARETVMNIVSSHVCLSQVLVVGGVRFVTSVCSKCTPRPSVCARQAPPDMIRRACDTSNCHNQSLTHTIAQGDTSFNSTYYTHAGRAVM